MLSFVLISNHSEYQNCDILLSFGLNIYMFWVCKRAISLRWFFAILILPYKSGDFQFQDYLKFINQFGLFQLKDGVKSPTFRQFYIEIGFEFPVLQQNKCGRLICCKIL